MPRDVRARALFLPVTGGVIGMAWVTLVLWERSPYGRYLDHGEWTDAGFAATLCRALPAGDVLLPFLLYAGGWLLMLVAMMLPTALPLLQRFDRMVTGRHDRILLLVLLIVGYLLVWMGFATIVHLLDQVLHLVLLRSAWLLQNGWLPGAAILLAAGAFQFSRLKYHCLERCRTPLGFILGHWRGLRPRLDAFRLGLDHGAFCVGCCWALMLLMFVIGTGSIGCMLVLGAIMAIEKNASWGRWLSKPLGAALIALGVAIAALHLVPGVATTAGL
jgi:predicted metal-binding membrane protein